MTFAYSFSAPTAAMVAVESAVLAGAELDEHAALSTATAIDSAASVTPLRTGIWWSVSGRYRWGKSKRSARLLDENDNHYAFKLSNRPPGQARPLRRC